MIVSWNWLKQYIKLDMDPAEVEHRMAMAGLNHEGSLQLAEDRAIDFEVTSNRADCLGHIGIAREIAVLWDYPLCLPAAAPASGADAARDQVKVSITCPDLCYRYSARLIRGVQVGPSPDWLLDRLRTIFHKNDQWSPVNNVVDITNYVLMECGQPLHAFDFGKLQGQEIIVRRARRGEQLEAIDHKTYALDDDMCVIADARDPVAIGGVMGGAASEVGSRTTDLLIESAEFSPLSIRRTARQLNLHSDSSYRFERGVDPQGVDWASRRCCELILEICGGQLAEGAVEVVARPAVDPQPIVLRFSQISRILGIEIAPQEIQRILVALGGRDPQPGSEQLRITPPSWRRDLTREIDLIEEVARIHGYDQIPEDVDVPMTATVRSDQDRVMERVRNVMTASGYDEAMCSSLVPEEWSEAFSPWTQAAPIVSHAAMRGVLQRPADWSPCNVLRRSLIPSLLEARRGNESVGNEDIELFETAKVYLPKSEGLPHEQWTLGMVSSQGYLHVKGTLETLLASVNPTLQLTTEATEQTLLDGVQSCRLMIDDQLFGFLGVITPAAAKLFKLRGPATVAEVALQRLVEVAELVPQYQELSAYPAMTRDLNLIVDEAIRWSDLARTVRGAAGEWLEELRYQDTYVDAKKDGPGRKRLLFSILFRASDRTLTGEEADQLCQRVVAACRENHHAELLS